MIQRIDRYMDFVGYYFVCWKVLGSELVWSGELEEGDFLVGQWYCLGVDWWLYFSCGRRSFEIGKRLLVCQC